MREFLLLVDFLTYTCTPMHIDLKTEEICTCLCTFM